MLNVVIFEEHGKIYQNFKIFKKFPLKTSAMERHFHDFFYFFSILCERELGYFQAIIIKYLKTRGQELSKKWSTNFL